MRTNRVYVGLGSNLGDRLKNINDALHRLALISIIEKASLIYETEPWGLTNQPKFLNQVVRCSTSLEPLLFLHALKKIEQELGRKATVRYGPRLIDLDILFYDNLILHTPDLSIPHPSIAERAFILVPLAEISPGLMHPVLRKTVRELLNNIDLNGVKTYKV